MEVGLVDSPAQKRMKRRICVLYCAGRVSVSTIMDSDNTNITGQAQYLDIVQRYIVQNNRFPLPLSRSTFPFVWIQGYILCISIISPAVNFFEFITQNDAILMHFPLF